MLTVKDKLPEKAKKVIRFGLMVICSNLFKYSFNAKLAEAVFLSHLYSRGAHFTSRSVRRLL